jgi:hypothetical protein
MAFEKLSVSLGKSGNRFYGKIIKFNGRKPENRVFLCGIQYS